MTEDNSIGSSLPELLLKFHDEEFTGIITVRDNSSSIKFYLKKGRMIYADGADISNFFIQEITSKRNLTQAQISEIKTIIEEDPHDLGKILIDRKIISNSEWNKFIEIKIKYNMTYALSMKNPEVRYDISQPDIPPINRYNFNIVQLVPEAIRNIKDTNLFKESLPDEDAIPFSAKKQLLQDGNVSLTTSEQKIVAMVNGKKSFQWIREHSWIPQDEFNRNYYLLQCMGLIEYHRDKARELDEENEYTMITNLYIDLLRIIQHKFQKEAGREFDKIFRDCLGKLPGYSKKIFRELNLSPELQKRVVKSISGHFTEGHNPTENRLLLTSSFNKILYPLILRMKKILGLGIAEATLNEMMSILQFFDKYQSEINIVSYLKANIEDYLKQIKL